MGKRVDTATRFVFSLNGKEQPGKGLFVAFQPFGSDDQVDPTLWTLGVCDVDGVLRVVTDVTLNPWAAILVRLPSNPNVRAKDPVSQAFPSAVLAPVQHHFALIAHPSRDRVARVFANLKAGNGPDGGAFSQWKIQALTPDASAAGLTVTLPQQPDAYHPGGGSAYGGWLLYRHMPYEGLSVVRAEVRKLAGQLAACRYPVGLSADGAPHPYPTSGAHAGQFDVGVQAALQAFHDDLAAARQDDIGDPMPAITAPDDAKVQGVSGKPVSFLNLSRLAFHLDLFNIGAQSGFTPPEMFGFSFVTINPAAAKNLAEQAKDLEKLAEGIELSAQHGKGVAITPRGGKRSAHQPGEFRTILCPADRQPHRSA